MLYIVYAKSFTFTGDPEGTFSPFQSVLKIIGTFKISLVLTNKTFQ